MAYIINLRLDVLLYARTVNGIRNYVLNHSDISLHGQLMWIVLPKSTHLPKYFEGLYFLWVVLAFAFVDALYAVAAMIGFFLPSYNSLAIQDIISDHFLGLLMVSGVTILLHVLLYVFLSSHRERGYLRSNIIGIDIDGVLNDHRTHFCKLLSEKTGKSLDPEAITQIPVHEIPDTIVTDDDETTVFNDPRYWSEMIVLEDASRVIKKLKNVFKLRVHIFTYRHWPKSDYGEETVEGDIDEEWNDHLRHEIAEQAPTFLRILRWIRVQLGISFVKRIYLITRYWLDQNDIPFDKLLVERGNENVSDPKGQFRNRFWQAKKRTIRYFVEDDLEKAIKLSFICEVVFLIDYPYNRMSSDRLPRNIVRVAGWKEIYREIRSLA